MKGLILKDYYMLLKYCRSYLLIIAVFTVVSFLGGSDSSILFAVYPCVFCGLVPTTLLAYDERCGWNDYCGALPYTKAQIVSSKYLFGLILTAISIVIMCVVNAVRVAVGGISLSDAAALLGLQLTAALAVPALCLPFLFLLGVEKGRIVHFAVIIVASMGVTIAAEMGSDVNISVSPSAVMGLACVAAAVLYALSWLLSIKFYERQCSKR